MGLVKTLQWAKLVTIGTGKVSINFADEFVINYTTIEKA